MSELLIKSRQNFSMLSRLCVRHVARCTAHGKVMLPEVHKESIKQAATELLNMPQRCGGRIHMKKAPSICLLLESATSPSSSLPQAKDQQASCSYIRLPPDSIFTSFSLASHGIMDHIRTVMLQPAGTLTAHLQELAMYRKGQEAEKDVHSPAVENKVGSLLMCIPITNEPCLVAPQKAGWHSVDVQAMDIQAVEWVAYSSTCNIQKLPALQGPCIVLRYDLKTIVETNNKPMVPQLSVATLDFRDKVVDMLSDPDFFPSGGRIGLPCQTVVPHTVWGLLDHVPSMLGGRDAACFEVLQQLGLKPRVLAAWSLEGHADEDELSAWYWTEKPGSKNPVYEVDYPDSYYDCTEDEDDTFYWGFFSDDDRPMLCLTELTPTRVNEFVPWSAHSIYGRDDARRKAILRFLKKAGAADVHWLDDNFTWFEKQTAAGGLDKEFFSETYMSCVYSTPVIVAKVPPWGSEQRLQILEHAQSI